MRRICQKLWVSNFQSYSKFLICAFTAGKIIIIVMFLIVDTSEWRKISDLKAIKCRKKIDSPSKSWHALWQEQVMTSTQKCQRNSLYQLFLLTFLWERERQEENWFKMLKTSYCIFCLLADKLNLVLKSFDISCSF